VEVPLERIESERDPRISAYQSVRDRDLHREGDFICEGETVLNVALSPRSLYTPTSILLAESRALLLSKITGIAPCPVYVAPQSVMDEIVGFQIHRGILACCKRAELPSPEALLSKLVQTPRARVVVLVGLANHDNVGGIFRSAAAFGADCILLDETSCDPLYRKSIRVSVGGALVVPFARIPLAQIASTLKAHALTSYAFALKGAQELSTLEPAPRSAILFGSEGTGLPGELTQACTSVRITMSAFDSLNVAVTAGIALHHFTFHSAR
jgi:tRNA G18 (ribose-2'-O)-methylase SpoU